MCPWVWGIAREFDHGAVLLAASESLATIPEGSAAVVLVTAADADALNSDRPLARDRRLRLVLVADREDASKLRHGAPDLSDWLRATIKVPDGPPWWAVDALREAMVSRRPLTWTGGGLGHAAELCGVQAVGIDASAPIADFLDRSKVPLLLVRGVDRPELRDRVQACLAEVGFRGACVLEGAAPDPAVDTREVSIARGVARLRAHGAGRVAGALAAAAAGRERVLEAVVSWLDRDPEGRARLLVEGPRAESLSGVPEPPDPPTLEPPSLLESFTQPDGAHLLDIAWNLLVTGFPEDAERVARSAPADAPQPLHQREVLAARLAWLRDGPSVGEQRLGQVVDHADPLARAALLVQWGHWLAAAGRHAEAALRWQQAEAAAPWADAVLHTRSYRGDGMMREGDREAAIRAIDAIPATGRIDRIQLLQRKAMFLGDVDRWQEALACARQARSLLKPEDSAELWWLQFWSSWYQQVFLEDPGAAATLAEAGSRFEAFPITVLVRVLNALMRRGRLERGCQLVLDDLIPRLHTPAAVTAMDGHLIERLGDAAVRLGLGPKVKAALEGLCSRLTDPGSRAECLLQIAHLSVAGGDPEAAQSALDQVDGGVLPPGRRRALAEARFDLARSLGRFTDASRIEEEEVGPTLDGDVSGWLDHLGRLAWVADEGGDLQLAEAIVRERALPFAREHGEPVQRARVLASLAWLRVRRGEPIEGARILREQVLPHLVGGERAVELVRLATALGSSGHRAEALAALAEARPLVPEGSPDLVEAIEALQALIGMVGQA